MLNMDIRKALQLKGYIEHRHDDQPTAYAEQSRQHARKRAKHDVKKICCYHDISRRLDETGRLGNDYLKSTRSVMDLMSALPVRTMACLSCPLSVA